MMAAKSRKPRQGRGAEAFPKGRRLRRRAEFLKTYEGGRKLAGRYVTVFALPDGESGVRLGVTVTKKTGRATVRNAARRRVREVFRRAALSSPAPGLRLVVNVHPVGAAAPFPAFAGELARLLRRAAEPPA
jgi:ribonuclease P protein component